MATEGHCRVELDRHGAAWRDHGTHRLGDLLRQACAIFQRDALQVAARAAQWREKLAEPVAMRSVNLHTVEPSAFGELCRLDEVLRQFVGVHGDALRETKRSQT